MKKFAILLALVVVFAIVGLVGYLPRRDRALAANAAAHSEQTDLPAVNAVKVVKSPADSEFTLPGSISAMSEASIYARAAGYVRKRYVDIGDRVKPGQLLAELDTPELDQQVAQTRAALAQARQQLAQSQAALVQYESQRDLAKVTAERYDRLLTRGAVARQDTDQQDSTYKSSEALVNAQQATIHAAEESVREAQANLDRMTALQDFQRVRAPFSGIVTARNIDAGYLITASGAAQGGGPLDVPLTQNNQTSSNGNEMFRIADTATLRILISVPQAYAPGIMIGMPAKVEVTEFPGRAFAGRVARTASALDPNSRTLPVQIEIPNKEGTLLPGMYAEVSFRSHRASPPLLVPGDSIIAGQKGSQVAILENVPESNAPGETRSQESSFAERSTWP